MSGEVGKQYLLGDFSIAPERRELRKGDQRLHLATRPFQVLVYLIDHRDRLVTRRELIDRFWEGKDVYDETLTKCVGTIRKALNDGPEGRFVDTRYGEGYRYIGPIHEEFIHAGLTAEIERTRGVRIVVEEEHIIDSEPTPTTTQVINTYVTSQVANPLHARKKRRFALVFAAIALMLCGLLVYQGWGHHALNAQPEAASASRVDSVAVIPLRNLTGDSSQDYLSDGISESLTTQLSRINGLRVISQTSTLTFKGKDIDPRELGKRLNVGAVMEGSFRKSGDHVYVTVRLVKVSDGQIIWATNTSDSAQRDVFTIEEEIACDIAANLQAKLCGEVEPLPRTSNIEAYHAYLKGRYFVSQQTSSLGPQGALERAISYFQQAIAIDPKYAPAYAGLADCYTQLNWFVADDPKSVILKAKSAALKAVQLDDSSGEAHTALATAYLEDWDFAAAAREHERAIALNPGVAWAYHEYSTYLITMGRPEEALAALKKAHDLDPLNPTIIADEANGLYIVNRYDEAIDMFRNVCRIDPTCSSTSEVANSNIGLCYLEKGMTAEAISNFERDVSARGRNPDPLVWLAIGYAASGRRAEAQQILQELITIAKKQYVPKIFLAYIYAALDQHDQALNMLVQAYLEHDVNLISLRTNKLLDTLRSERRFQDLVRRVGLQS